MSQPPPSNSTKPVYVISVAAELVDMHPQTLRMYERRGLVQPGRSGGKTRLYSEQDIETLREIRRLTQEMGVNLAGVEEIMRLQTELGALEADFRRAIVHIDSALERAWALPSSEGDPKDKPVYVISVAAELVGMHPQTLRMYERKALVQPGRSSGKTRLYSERDIETLQEIRRLTQERGINLAGVEEIMRLQAELQGRREQLENNLRRLNLDLGEQMQRLKLALPPLSKED